VEGFLSEYQGERRIKTASKNDIRFLETTSLPEAVLVQAEDIGEELEGRFVVLQGELTEIKGSAWWLDDQTGEVKIYINQNTGIKKGEIKIGDSLQVRGIVSQWQDEYRILPRYPEDIKVIGKVLGETDQPQSVINNQSSIINSNSGIFKYLLAGAAAIIIILMVIIIKRKNE